MCHFCQYFQEKHNCYRWQRLPEDHQRYIGNKFDCPCQISSVYATNAAFSSLVTVISVILLQLAHWPPSCAQGRSRSGTHTVLRFCWGWACSDAVILQKTLEMYQHKAETVWSSLLWKVSASSTDVLMEMGSQDGISAVLRISFVFT